MVTRAELFKNLDYEIQFYSKNTQQQYRNHVSDYLDWVKRHRESLDAWSERDTVYAYAEYLKSNRHLSQSTIGFVLRGPIGTLFRMQQPSLRMPVKLPKVSRGSMMNIEERKGFTEWEITQLILTARESGNFQWQNLMALASIYMVRAGEVTQIKKSDVHPLKKTIVIHTLKGGLTREHMVPNAIAPYIFKYDYPELPDKRIHVIFRDLAKAAGVDLGERKNIHAVRHGVFTALSNLRDSNDQPVYDVNDLYRFARWAGGNITETYNHVMALKIDEVVFKHHPFLVYWK
jgi:integrase